MSDDECFHQFRFDKATLYRLIVVLRLAPEYRASNGTKWTALEGLCIMLKRLSYPNRLVDCVHIFGRHKTELSIISNAMITDLFQKHSHLLKNINQGFVQPEVFAHAINDKGCPLQNVWAFIDGTLRANCRPQVHQEEVFSGHKRRHGLKYQSLIYPNGIIGHCFGPVEGRRHDSAVYHQSDIDDLISNVHSEDGTLMAVFADTAYAAREYLITSFKGAALTQEMHNFNRLMSSVRESVEWGFSKVCTLFAFVDYHKNQKIYLQPIAKYYLVSALLTNAHTCAYGSQVSMYFGLEPPSLEEYFVPL